MVFSARLKRSAMRFAFFSSLMAVNSTVRTRCAILLIENMNGMTNSPSMKW